MTQHDTPEAVDAMAKALEEANYRVIMHSDGIAAMLRRLHQRAVDAEQESTDAMARILRENDDLRAALATARADALREAVDIADAVSQRASHNRMRAVEDCHTGEIHHQEGRWHAANDIGEDIAILATKEKTHDR